MNTTELFAELNNPSLEVRLSTVRELGRRIKSKEITMAKETSQTNNHIHTMFSFCPHYPATAAALSKKAGLQTCGSADHDSYAAAPEMKEAGRQIGIGTTVAVELRVDFSEFGFGDRKINNPDSLGIAYVIAHGIPVIHADKVNQWLKPINLARNLRNQRMVGDLNSMLAGFGIKPLDFERDVWAASEAKNGGSITERHILYALSRRILDENQPEKVVSYLTDKLGLRSISPKLQKYVTDPTNPHRVYDLLGVLKSEFLPGFYIQPNTAECIPGSEFLRFTRSVDGIPTYAILGDIAESPTGDKKAEKFEDEYIDTLVPTLVDAGFLGLAYMLTRNTREQALRYKALAQKYSRPEINGVDINSSRQTFECKELEQPGFEHLADSAWMLVGHEYEVCNGRAGVSFEKGISLATRDKQIKHYADIGRRSVHEA